MTGKSKASDRTNLGTVAAPINYSKLIFSEQPFYENHSTLDSHARPSTRQDSFQNRHRKRSLVYGSTKIEF